LGFIHYPNFNDLNDKDKQMIREDKLTKDSWNFLTKNNEIIDTWKLLVFCFTVLGLYDGEGQGDISNMSFVRRTGRKNTNTSNNGNLFFLDQINQLNIIEEDGEKTINVDDELLTERSKKLELNNNDKPRRNSLFKIQDIKKFPEEKPVNSSIHSTEVKNKVNNDTSRQECNLNGKQHLNLL